MRIAENQTELLELIKMRSVSQDQLNDTLKQLKLLKDTSLSSQMRLLSRQGYTTVAIYRILSFVHHRAIVYQWVKTVLEAGDTEPDSRDILIESLSAKNVELERTISELKLQIHEAIVHRHSA